MRPLARGTPQDEPPQYIPSHLMVRLLTVVLDDGLEHGADRIAFGMPADPAPASDGACPRWKHPDEAALEEAEQARHAEAERSRAEAEQYADTWGGVQVRVPTPAPAKRYTDQFMPVWYRSDGGWQAGSSIPIHLFHHLIAYIWSTAGEDHGQLPVLFSLVGHAWELRLSETCHYQISIAE